MTEALIAEIQQQASLPSSFPTPLSTTNPLSNKELLSNSKEGGLLGGYNPVVYGVTPSNVYMPSKREWLIASTFVKALLSGEGMRGIYQRCSDSIVVAGMKRVPQLTCKRWLEREHVQEWMEGELKLHAIKSYWTKERWLLRMTEHLDGIKRMANGDLYGMKLLASCMGWEAPEAQIVTQINFTERE